MQQAAIPGATEMAANNMMRWVQEGTAYFQTSKDFKRVQDQSLRCFALGFIPSLGHIRHEEQRHEKESYKLLSKRSVLIIINPLLSIVRHIKS